MAKNEYIAEVITSVEYDGVKFLHVEKKDQKVTITVEFQDGGKAFPHVVEKVNWATVLTSATVGSSTVTIHGDEGSYVGYSVDGGNVTIEIKQFPSSHRFVSIDFKI